MTHSARVVNLRSGWRSQSVPSLSCRVVSDGSPSWTENGSADVLPRYYGRWWIVGALFGLLAGWLVGLAIKPGPDELLAVARALAPPGTQITEAVVTDDEFELIPFNPDPFAFLHLVSDLSPDELATAMEENALTQGWTVLPRNQLFGTTVIRLRTTFFEASAFVWADAVQDDARVFVQRHDWTGPVLVASASILGGLTMALVLAAVQRRFMAAPDRLYRPWRWWQTTGVLTTAALFWFCLTFVR